MLARLPIALTLVVALGRCQNGPPQESAAEVNPARTSAQLGPTEPGPAPAPGGGAVPAAAPSSGVEELPDRIETQSLRLVWRGKDGTIPALGAGVDPIQMMALNRCVEGSPGSALESSSRIVVQFLESTTAMIVDQSFQLEADLPLEGLTLVPSLAYIQGNKKASRSKRLMVWGRSTTTSNWDDLRLLESARQYLAAGETGRQQFVDKCGTSFVRAIESGVEVAAFVEFSDLSASDFSDLRTAVGVSAPADLAGLRARLQDQWSQIASTSTCSIDYTALGISQTGLDQPKSCEEALNHAVDWVAEALRTSPGNHTFSVTLNSYHVVHGFPQMGSKDVLRRRELMGHLRDVLAKAAALRGLVDERASTDSQRFRPPEARGKCAKRLESASHGLADTVARLQEAEASCEDVEQPCDPEPLEKAEEALAFASDAVQACKVCRQWRLGKPKSEGASLILDVEPRSAFKSCQGSKGNCWGHLAGDAMLSAQRVSKEFVPSGRHLWQGGRFNIEAWRLTDGVETSFEAPESGHVVTIPAKCVAW